MQKISTFLLALIACAGNMFAESVQIGNLYYNLNADNKTAEVTYQELWSETNYSYLTAVNIPESVDYNSETYSVTSIGDYAFYSCTGLKSITIPNCVTSIGEYAFEGCSGLTSMVVASENTKYDSRENCNAIIETSSNTLIAGCKSTIIPNSVTSIGEYAFEFCTGLTSIEIPNSVTSIGEWAFAGCYGLTSVTIGNSVTSIGSGAFYHCTGLTSVTIGNSVTSIGLSAFESCSGLTSITCHALTPPTCDGYYVFNNVDKSIPLYIPEESVDLYKAAEVWKDFTNIQTIDETHSIGEVNQQPAANPAQKLIRNGNVYILTGDRTYTVTGQQLK